MTADPYRVTLEDAPHPSPYPGFCLTCEGLFEVGDSIRRVAPDRRRKGRSDYEHTVCPATEIVGGVRK